MPRPKSKTRIQAVADLTSESSDIAVKFKLPPLSQIILPAIAFLADIHKNKRIK